MAGDLNTDREVAANVRFTEILPLRKTGHTSKGDQLKWKSPHILPFCGSLSSNPEVYSSEPYPLEGRMGSQGLHHSS